MEVTMAPVIFEKKGKIAYVTINRPESMNALNRETQVMLKETWEKIEADDDIWVAILTGAGGKAFSAGADLKEGEGVGRNYDYMRLKGFLAKGPRAREVSKPLIAAIDGYCLAGGLELALACDIRIASENSTFGAPEPKWSLINGYGALVMPWTVHSSNMMELLLTGQFIDANEALRIGLVSRVVSKSKLMDTVDEIAEKILQNAPLALKVTKELARLRERQGLEQSLRTYYSYHAFLDRTEDYETGNTAFRDKRKPEFKGK